MYWHRLIVVVVQLQRAWVLERIWPLVVCYRPVATWIKYLFTASSLLVSLFPTNEVELELYTMRRPSISRESSKKFMYGNRASPTSPFLIAVWAPRLPWRKWLPWWYMAKMLPHHTSCWWTQDRREVSTSPGFCGHLLQSPLGMHSFINSFFFFLASCFCLDALSELYLPYYDRECFLYVPIYVLTQNSPIKRTWNLLYYITLRNVGLI